MSGVWKGWDEVSVVWSAGGTVSDPVEIEAGAVPIAILAPPSGWNTADISFEIKDAGGTWYRLKKFGGDYTVNVPVGAGGVGTINAVDSVEAALALMQPEVMTDIRLVSSVSQSNGATLKLRLVQRAV